MGRYRNDPDALTGLVQPDRVHRDVREVFQVEVERLWSRAWVYAGHTSQIPREGDYLTVDRRVRHAHAVRLYRDARHDTPSPGPRGGCASASSASTS